METIRSQKSIKSKSKRITFRKGENHIENLIKYGNLERQQGDGESTPDTMSDLQKHCDSDKVRNIRSEDTPRGTRRLCTVDFQVDFISICLFLCGLATRMYQLQDPKNIV